MKPTDAEVQALKEANPGLELMVLEHPKPELVDAAVIVKPVNRGTYKRFRVQSQDPKGRDLAVENLVRACVLWPAKDELDAQVERYPAIFETWCSQLLESAGLSAEAEKKVL